MSSRKNVPEFCRFCLATECFYLTDIFDKNFNYPLKIYEALSINVSMDDELPKKICEFCICNLAYIQNFKNLTAKAEKQFNSYLETSNFHVNSSNEQRAESKMKYSMTSHFRKLEQQVIKNIDNFSLNFNIKGERTETILIKPDPDDVKNETTNPLADWNLESSSVKIEPNSDSFLVTESTTAAKLEPEELIEGSGQVKKMKQIKKIKVEQALKRRSLIKIKKERKRSVKKERFKDDGKKICELCGKTFTGSMMVYHMNSHYGIYPYKCDVEGCETALTSPYKLREHKEVHDNARRYSCELCGRQFKQKKGVKRHMTFHMDPLVECEICGKMLRRKDILKKHMMTHTGERPAKCLHCEKAFTDKHKLKVHMTVHTGARNYVCNICGMAYAHNCSLRAHTEKIHFMAVAQPPINSPYNI